MNVSDEFTLVNCSHCGSERAIFPEDPAVLKCYSCGGSFNSVRQPDIPVAEPDPTTSAKAFQVTTTNDALAVFSQPDLEATVLARLPKGVDLALLDSTVIDGREWFRARVGGEAGYVLAPSARGHTTLGEAQAQQEKRAREVAEDLPTPPRQVRTIDEALEVHREPDLTSSVVVRVPAGAAVQLGAVTVKEGDKWIEITVDNNVGYVLDLQARAHTTFEFEPTTQSAPGSKLWICANCNRIIADPLRDLKTKRQYCRAGHRVFPTRGPSAGFARYVGDVIVLFLLGGGLYLASYYVPQVFRGLLDKLLFAEQAFPDLAHTLVRLVTWGVVILRLILVFGVSASEVRAGLTLARREQPAKCYGREKIFQNLAGFSGFFLTGYVLLQVTAEAGSEPVYVTLYRLILNVDGLQLWQ